MSKSEIDRRRVLNNSDIADREPLLYTYACKILTDYD